MSNTTKAGRQKTRSAAKKRITRTKGGKGKLVIQKVANNHLLLQKSKGQKAKASQSITLSKADANKAKKMMI